MPAKKKIKKLKKKPTTKKQKVVPTKIKITVEDINSTDEVSSEAKASALEPVVVLETPELVQDDNKGLRPTGIADLDKMLGGGLPERATVLLSGDAGVGKTTLAMEWLFGGYSKYQETGVYITLTEPTTVAIQDLDSKTFFNKDYIASCDINASQVKSEIAARAGVHFVDLRQLLEEMKLFKTEYTYDDIDKILDVIFDMIMSSGVSRVVIDSITAIAYLLGDKNLIRTFIYKMGKFLALSNANTLLIGEAKDKKLSVFGVEEFISDGVIKLSYEGDGQFPIRTLQIKKMRGIPFNSRPTPYKITNDGIRLFLREEKHLVHETSNSRLPTGIPGFDKLILGGLIAESAVLISGPSGGGKTLLSIQTMMSNLKNGKKCLYISHEESRGQIIRNALVFGWDLDHFEKEGLLKIEAIHPDEVHLSELIFKVKVILDNFIPELVVVDSLTAIANLYEEDVVHDWSSQLISLFKKKKILSLFVSATANLVGESMASNVGISSLFDQIIMIRFVEIDAEFHHAILIVKMRGSKHDKKMYRFIFNDNGLKILNSFSGYEGIFSGSAKQVSKSKEDQLHEVFLEMMGPMGEEIFSQERAKNLSIESISKLLLDLGDKGILSAQRVEEFSNRTKIILESNIA